MSTWKKKILGGVERIFKDGRAIMEPEELEKVPSIVKGMGVGDSLEFEDSAPLPPEMPISEGEKLKETPMPKSIPHVSVLSGEPAERRRFLNGQEYWLTDGEYEKYNLGKLAQALREKSTETVEE